MGLLKDIFGFRIGQTPNTAPAPKPDNTILPNEPQSRSEIGARTTPENEIKYLFRTMWVDPDVRQSILDIREMDKLDGRVKRIHGRVARDTIKGGLLMQQATQNETLSKLWQDFGRRLQLNRPEKLRSDARGLVMEGNLPLQWVLDESFNVVSAVRMPSETIIPNVDTNGRFKDIRKAYVQFDVSTGRERVTFPLWQLFLCRYDPENFDDMGALGRPFLDGSRTTWRKLTMTEEDLVIRRRVRAPLRLLHAIEGATKEELDEYRARVENDQRDITTDYYANKKSTVQPVQGDANLDQIRDVVHLLDSFFAGSPLPKGMMGFTDNLARDILEDLKRDYYEEVDSLQDTLAFAYEAGFRLDLLLKGINPDADDFSICFGERRTETPNQTADRALKLQALGIPADMVWEEMGYNAAYVRKRREEAANNHEDPYPDPNAIAPSGTARVSVTPGNGRKGESGTAISNR